MNQPNVVLETERFRVEQVPEPLRDGSSKSRHVIRHPGAVAIVPVLSDKRVCLIRNRRVAVARELIELPAGTREPGEDPRNTAIRELQEETGFVAQQVEQLHEFFLAPGIMDERMTVYLATDLTPGDARLEANEFIENVILSLDDALKMCRDGTIEDAKTLVGLFIYEHHLRG